MDLIMDTIKAFKSFLVSIYRVDMLKTLCPIKTTYLLADGSLITVTIQVMNMNMSCLTQLRLLRVKTNSPSQMRSSLCRLTCLCLSIRAIDQAVWTRVRGEQIQVLWSPLNVVRSVSPARTVNKNTRMYFHMHHRKQICVFWLYHSCTNAKQNL